MPRISVVDRPAPTGSDTARRFALLDSGGHQVGKPNRDIRVLLQRSYDLLAEADMHSLSPRQKNRLSYTIIEL